MTEEEKINIKEQFNYIVKDGIAPNFEIRRV